MSCSHLVQNMHYNDHVNNEKMLFSEQFLTMFMFTKIELIGTQDLYAPQTKNDVDITPLFFKVTVINILLRQSMKQLLPFSSFFVVVQLSKQ